MRSDLHRPINISREILDKDQTSFTKFIAPYRTVNSAKRDYESSVMAKLIYGFDEQFRSGFVNSDDPFLFLLLPSSFYIYILYEIYMCYMKM